MTATGLLRICFRWKTPGLVLFGALLLVSLGLALALPRVYESQVILERKPIKITPVVSKQDDEEFDVYRLTSESQRNVALFKSRYMMDHWLDAIGLTPRTPREKEREIAKLLRSLTVQPVSYTDLFIVKVKSFSPEEASRRAGLLVQAFTEWDSQLNNLEAQQLSAMLRERMTMATRALTQQYAQLKNQKSLQMLSLSGSGAAHQLEVNLTAQTKLIDLLTTELEEAERQLQSERISRTRILAPPTLPGKPVLSIARRILLAVCASAAAAIGFIFFLEWQDPSIRRTQDIVREIPSYPILTIPASQNGSSVSETAPYLGLLADVVGEHARAQGSALIQFVGFSEEAEHMTISRALASVLAHNFRICQIHQVAGVSRRVEPSAELLPKSAQSSLAALEVSLAEPLTQHLTDLKNKFDLFLLTTDHLDGIAPGGNLAQEASLICILVTAGRTSRHFLRALRQTLRRYPNQNFFFVLNHYRDPLPLWIQSPFSMRVGH